MPGTGAFETTSDYAGGHATGRSMKSPIAAIALAVAAAGCSYVTVLPERGDPPPRFGEPTQLMTSRPYAGADIMPGALLQVWANDAGASAYRAEARPFPVGSMIVLETVGYVDGRDDVQTTYLVMRKMRPGYGSAHGDWYYAIHDARTNAPTTEGRLTLCIDCHAKAAATDYVFGVPDAVKSWSGDR